MSFQLGLTTKYIAMIYFGLSAAIASVPAFQDAAPKGYAIVWAVALVVGGVLGAFGSVSRAKWFERIELIGATLVTLTVGSYAATLLALAYGEGDAGRAAAGAGFIALTMPSLIRTMWLFSQSLRK